MTLSGRSEVYNCHMIKLNPWYTLRILLEELIETWLLKKQLEQTQKQPTPVIILFLYDTF
jgi:hypothetical protein